jgi:hypothetical protein
MWILGSAARRIPSQASAASVVCAVCRTMPAAIAQGGSSRSLSKSLSIQSSTGMPSRSRTKISRAVPPTQAAIRASRCASDCDCSGSEIAHLVEADGAADLHPAVV